MSPDAHPTPAELELFLAGEAPHELAVEIVRHLAPGCSTCTAAMAPAVDALLSPPGHPPERYDFPVARALRSVSPMAAFIDALPQARVEIGATLEAIFADEPAPPSPGTPAHLWAGCELLLEAAAELRGVDVLGAIHLATLASLRAERLAGPWPAALQADLKARAWAELGNAYRIANDPVQADNAFAHAAAAMGQGTGDDLLRARLADLFASLKRDQHLFAEAHRAIDIAIRVYLAHGERHLAGRSTLLKGQIFREAGEPEAALDRFQAALPLLDVDREPGLLVALLHNWLLALLDAGQAERAARMIWTARPVFETFGTPLHCIRFRGLEARIALATGQPSRAESLFRQEITGFMDHGMVYDAAMESLELSELLVSRKRPSSEAVELLDGSLTAFLHGGFSREAIGALVVLRHSLVQGEATVAIIQETAARLRALGPPPRTR